MKSLVLSALALAASTFRRYSEIHALKPDPVKAKANSDLADQMNEAIADYLRTPSTPPETSGWFFPAGTPPVWKFNPYTGTERHAGDILTDPQGVLLVPPGAQLRAAPKRQDEIHADYPTEEILALLAVGYAPGRYTNRCLSCNQLAVYVDKHTHRCVTCARAAYKKLFPDGVKVEVVADRGDGPNCEDGPDEEGFKGPRPWNSFQASGPGTAEGSRGCCSSGGCSSGGCSPRGPIDQAGGGGARGGASAPIGALGGNGTYAEAYGGGSNSPSPAESFYRRKVQE